MLKQFLTLLAALAVCSAHAERSGAVMGIGLLGCGDYVKWRTERNPFGEVQTQEWTLGLISAYNLFGDGPQVNAPPTYATVSLYLEKFCRENPLGTIDQGSLKMIRELRGPMKP